MNLEIMLQNLHKIEDDKVLEKETRNFIELLITVLISNVAQEKEDLENGQRIILKKKDAQDFFWGYVFNLTPLMIDFNLQAAMAVGYRRNNYVLYVNPKYFKEDWTVQNIFEILRHEGFHLLYGHLTQYKDYMTNQIKQFFVNIATDCEINQHLKNLPEGCVTLALVEKICKKKLKEKEGSLYYLTQLLESGNKDQNSDGDNRHDTWKEVSEDEESFLSPEDSLKKLINKAHENMEYISKDEKDRSEMYGKILEQIAKINQKSQVKWQSEVKNIMGNKIFGKEETLNRLNRRLPNMLHKKGMIDSFINPVVFAIDTSGSVSNKELSYFLNELSQLIKQTKIPVEVIEFDAQIQRVKSYDVNHHKIDYNVEGRCGTIFQCVFDYLKEKKYNPLTNIFILTDGGGESKINTHQFHNYKWLVTDNYRLSVENNKKKIIRIRTKEE